MPFPTTTYCGFEVSITDPLSWQPFVWRSMRRAIERSSCEVSETVCCYWRGQATLCHWWRTVEKAMQRKS